MFVVKVTQSVMVSYTSSNSLRHIGGEVTWESIREQERGLFKSHTLYMVREINRAHLKQIQFDHHFTLWY